MLSTLCNPPSHWGTPPHTWPIIGEFAHLVAMGDYLTKMGGMRGIDIYFDTFELIPIDPAYAAFMIRHNPALGAAQQVFLSITPLKRPDLMIHRTLLTEYDEVKPDSILGVADGMSKIYQIAAYMHLLGLPYGFGNTYTPTRHVPLFTTSLGGIPVEVSMKFERKRPGLIVYEICIKTDWAKVVKSALIALIVFLLMLLIRRLPIPGPAPVPVPVAATGQMDFTVNPRLTRLLNYSVV